MSLKSRSQTVVILPAGTLESYMTLAMVSFKNRSMVAYEYQPKSIPEVLAMYNKIPMKPCLVDSDLSLCGGLVNILNYLDNRYPVPCLLPGESAEYGMRLNLLTVMYDRVEQCFVAYGRTKSKHALSKLRRNLKTFAESMEMVADSGILDFDDRSPTIIEVFATALLMHLREIGVPLSIFAECRKFTLYLGRVSSLPYLADSVRVLEKTRSEVPFWEVEGFDVASYI